SKIKMLINYSVKRKIDSFVNEILEEKIDPLNSKEKFASWSDKLNQIIDTQDIEYLEHIKDSVDVYTHKLFESVHNTTNNKLTGITSGYEGIDEYTNGFQNGDLIILAARPSVGKTALAINFILNAARTLDKNDECIIMFSLEMSKEQIIQRMLSNLASIDSRILRSSRIDSDYIMTISNNSEILKKLPIYIDDSPNTTILDIEAKLRQFIKNKKIKLVVIDYLQLINGIGGSSSNRVTEVGKISRHLKNLARSLEVPIIAIAQLSRKIEERKMEDRQPMLSDLRESGNIEQDADLVTFIDIDYSALQMNNKLKDTNIDFNKYKAKNPQMTFYIEKHRNGLTGTVKLIFNKSTGQFVGINSNNTNGFN
ncbi:MAG: AAA family ATPase, partial [Ureaplasma sp.]|nr:AAA family ATPase [Ureaplasma sp.]